MKKLFPIVTLLLLFSVTALAQTEGIEQDSIISALEARSAEQDTVIAELEAEIARKTAEVVERKLQFQRYIDTLAQDVALSAPYSFAKAERIAADPNATYREKYLAALASKRRSGHMEALLSEEPSVPVDSFMVMLTAAIGDQVYINTYFQNNIEILEGIDDPGSQAFLAKTTLSVVSSLKVKDSQYNHSGYVTQLPDAPVGCYELGANYEFALLMYYEDTCKRTADLVEAVQAYLPNQ